MSRTKFQQNLYIAHDLGDGQIVKLCFRCKHLKPIENYSPDTRRTDGKQGVCKNCFNISQNERRTPEQNRDNNLKTNYGIDDTIYKLMYKNQEGKCLICKQFSERLSVDHCHNYGHVRGLLCINCNMGIGNLQDNPLNTEMANRYITDIKKN